MKNEIVFSTDPNYADSSVLEKRNNELDPGEQNLRIWIEKRPANKIVSIIRGFSGTDSELKDLSKIMKKRCGVGGSVKAGEIIIQTKDREKLLQILNNLGYFAKLSGG
ncbi:MAG: translation initiation factor [Candidatus Neomarinimicrobiota bacterium]